MITLGLDRGDVEHFMDDSDKFRLVIGTEAGESRAIDAIEEVLKKLGSVIEEVDHAKYLMYIEHGTDNEKTLMVIGDSFRLRLEKYMPYRYQKTLFVRIDDFDQELLDKYEPDDVIVITVERDQRYMEKLDSYIIQDSGE